MSGRPRYHWPEIIGLYTTGLYTNGLYTNGLYTNGLYTNGKHREADTPEFQNRRA